MEHKKEYIQDDNLVSEINGWYEVVTKDKEGEAHVHRLEKHSTKKRPLNTVETGDFIRQAAPTRITPSRSKRVQRADSLTIALGDAQIGYRDKEPFHDERAMALAQIAIKQLQPDNIVFTGDMIDLPAQGRFAQRVDWQNTTQDAIDRYHLYLAQTRANAPNARIVVVHGNHEERMATAVQRDAAHLMGLRRAERPDELSVLTLPFLVRYSDLEVEAVTGYPNGRLWLEDNLQVTHGTNVKKAGSNAAKYLQENDESIIFGHTHRMEIAWQTRATRLGGRAIVAASPGCLARIDGAVPGFHHTVDDRQQTVLRHEDWQQGLLMIEHNERVHDVSPARITEEGVRIYSKMYELPEEN